MSLYAPVLGACGRALRPLERALADPDALGALLADLGWATVPDDAVLQHLQQLLPLSAIQRAVALGRQLAATGSLGAADVADLAAQLAEIAAAVNALAGLTADDLTALPIELSAPELWADVAAVLPGHLLVRQLDADVPALSLLLRLTGVVLWERRNGASGGGRWRVHWDRLPDALTDPLGALAGTVRWGPQFRADPLLQLVRLGLARLGIASAMAPASEAVLEAIVNGNGATPRAVVQSELVFARGASATAAYEVGLVAASAATDVSPDGLYIGNLVLGTLQAGAKLSDQWTLALEGEASGTATVGAILRPGQTQAVTAMPSGEVALRLVGTPAGGAWRLLGSATGTRVELTGLDLGFGLTVDGADTELWAEAVVPADGLGLVLDFGAADALVRATIGSAIPKVAFGGTVRVGSKSGLSVEGGVGLELTIPVEKQLGPVYVDALTAAISFDGDGPRLGLTVDADVMIGPVGASFDGVGAALALRTANGSGGFAGIDAALDFLPPTRIVFALDSEVVRGGGFVEIDPGEGRYAGGFALDVLGFGISAVVIVDTEIPGDADAWALFASLGMTFITPIPLGFGFTLNGVGGVLALNRTIDVDALAGALATGAADSLLFPDDILNDATAILDGLDRWLPARVGTTIVGPAVEIGWGSPTLITAQLGVMIAIPDLIVTLLGSVEMLLPTSDDPLLSLRMDLLGAVDVPGGTVTVAASLYDSNLLGVYELSGDMGFYARLTGQPLFVLSVGGYHPSFDPPGALPSWLLGLRRTRAAIDLGDAVEVALESYVAVTSNTLQFGGGIEIVASAVVLGTTYTAEGWFGINVLLVLTPFKLVADAGAGVAVSAGDRELLGVDLALHLEGPKPWYATGRATFRFFGLDVDFGFDVGGRAGGEPRPIHPVHEDVLAALQDAAAWKPVDTGAVWAKGVTTTDTLPAGLWLRPDQAVEARQSVAPLNRAITAYGETTPALPIVEAGDVTMAGGAVANPDWIEDWFAPAQFDRLGDTARLSQPSYELMTAGVRFGDDAASISANVARECTTVSRAPETDFATRPLLPDYVSPPTRSPRATGRRAVKGPILRVAPTRYTIVRSETGARATDVLNDGGAAYALPFAAATALLEERVAEKPADRSRLRIAPTHAVIGG